ncbi:divalent-cation tolerance protein CutA [Parvibaculum sp.]|uniref:divalent-cation tolerance protein CutA n=1 Tax=Parvibaculum sp. TaxID=2024848 RepID=UPI002CD56015|nr:divalent-cation tolerance protein CutA [Parvibaculum sp.]HUD52319.1 divalent-cation tolerance protein CutA [Parvibaculum sp.]
MSDATQTGSEFVFIYTPLPDMGAAEAMARALVDARLAACVNIYPGIMSVYEWKGEAETSVEVVAFVKTRRGLVDETLAAMRKLHPYEVPAFLVLPIEGGNEDYLTWARGQVKS